MQDEETECTDDSEFVNKESDISSGHFQMPYDIVRDGR